MVTPELVVQQFVNGLSIGAIYALVAVGLTLIFGIMDVINFAHGEFVMLGAYAGFWILALTGLPYPVALVLAIVTVAAAAVVIERAVFRPLYDRSMLAIVMVAFGLLLFLQNAALMAWGGIPKAIADPFGNATLRVAGFYMSYLRIFAMALTFVLFGGMWVVLVRTKVGKAMRATAQNPEAAVIRGIDTDRVYMTTFAISGALAAAAGVVYGTLFSVSPAMGLLPLLKAFAAIVIGGLGSVTGALLGGLLIGVVEAMGAGLLPGGSGYRDAFAFVLLIVVLLVRPQGLLGGWQR